MSARPSDHVSLSVLKDMLNQYAPPGWSLERAALEAAISALAPVTPQLPIARAVNGNLVWLVGPGDGFDDMGKGVHDLYAGPVTPASGVDWRAMYRFQTAMRFMDNVPKLTRDRAYQMADDEMRGLEAQTPSRDQGEG